MTMYGGRHRRAFALVAVVVLVLAASVTGAHGISRSFVLLRAETWIAKKVPYSQSRYATVEGSLLGTETVAPSTVGYRTDCSGFVSMCLNLRSRTGRPYSLSTANLDDALIPITKARLRPGDVILRPNDLVIDGRRVSYGHAVIFVRWTDATQESYVGYHQSGSAKGAVRSTITWGTSGFGTAKGFAPYRYVAVRDRVKSSAASNQ